MCRLASIEEDLCNMMFSILRICIQRRVMVVGGGSENTCTAPAAPCKDTCDSDAEGEKK